MKIVFVIEHAHPHIGGVETVFKELAQGLRKRGHSVKILSSSSSGKIGHLVFNDIDYYYFSWLSFFNHAIPNAKNLEEYISEADIVHTTTYTAAPVALQTAKKYHKPCIITVHEVLSEKWFFVENVFKASLFYLFERYVVTLPFDFYHVVSEATKKDLLKIGIEPEKIVRIYNGIDNSYQVKDGKLSNKQLNEKKIFLYYGRRGKTKGIQIFEKAISLLKGKLGKDIQFKILPLLPKEKLIAEIKKSYCVIIPSLTEGFGFTAAEACALGKPVVVSDAGSLPEVVWGKVLFFKNRDPNDLVKKILLAIDNRFKAIPKKEFSWEKTIKEIEKLYEKMIQNVNFKMKD